jgi:hypothetical protein
MSDHAILLAPRLYAAKIDGMPGKRNPNRARARILVPLAAAALLLANSCQPDLLVRLSTRVYHDGSLERRLELRGWTSEGEIPTDDDWFAEKAGLRLAAPEAWNRIERRPGRIDAEGFYLSVDDLPAVFRFHIGEHLEKTDRIRTALEIDDRIVIKRWKYMEMHGDPFSREDAERALSALADLAVEALEKELRSHFGEALETGPAADLLRDQGRSLFSALLSVDRRVSNMEDEKRIELQKQVLAQHGAPVHPVEEPSEFWERETPLLFEWSRGMIADALNTPDYPVAPDDLSFWPVGDDLEMMAQEIIERVWGDEETLWELADPHLSSLTGYYKGGDTPGFRFEVLVELPGTLLIANGTPDEAGVRWLFRDEDLALSDTVLRVETVEPIVEPLIALGARRSFSKARLMQLADLLWKRDPQGILSQRLGEAVQQGDIDLLRDEEAVPDGYKSRVRELANLLDSAD